MTNLPTLFEDSNLSGLPVSDPGSGRPWLKSLGDGFVIVIDAAVDLATTDYLDGELIALGATKANVSHSHSIGDVTGLQTALDAKQTALGYTPVSKAGDTMTGTLAVSFPGAAGSSPLISAREYNNPANLYFQIAYGQVYGNSFICPASTGTNTAVTYSGFYCNESGVIQWQTGSTWYPALTYEIRIRRVSSGLLEINAANGLQIKDAAGSGDAPLKAGITTVGSYTFATVPSASANTGGTIRITDRSHRLATSDGTNWNWAGTTTAIS